MSVTKVNADNFPRVESDHMFAAILKDNGGEIGKWMHNREPTPLDHQPVIRQNRDTLYSALIADISKGGTLTIPDGGDRYLSVMVVNQDHFINQVFHDAGTYELTVDDFDTPYVLLAARILVDPANPDDVVEVNALQDKLVFEAKSNEPFTSPEYDGESYSRTRAALLELARDLDGFNRAFGRKEDVDPVRYLIGSAAGWGGLPDTEAQYLNVDPGLPLGEYKIDVGNVPVDAFWSISLYNKDGYFEPNKRNLNSVNSITAVKNQDGTITVNFGVSDDDKPNYFPIMEGWNYMVRLYRPHQEIIDGSWSFPAIQPA